MKLNKKPTFFLLFAILTGVWFTFSGCTESTDHIEADSSTLKKPDLESEIQDPVSAAEKRPLIYFSITDPAANASLRADIINELNLDPNEDFPLRFGGNRIGDYTILVIKGSKETAMQFDHVSQLFSFIVRNGWHSKEQTYSYSKLTESLFYQSKPLQLTCGKYSTYFIKLAVDQMDVDPDQCRNILAFPHTGGGHSLREIYFRELRKWVMFDTDAGLIPFLDRTPLHMLELGLTTEDEYDEAILTGLELYGRGPMDNQFGQGPSAKIWADGLLKSSRFHFAMYKKKHHVMLPVEDISDRTRALLNHKKEDPYFQVYHNKPEIFRYRYYKASHTRMNPEGREQVLKFAKSVWNEVEDDAPNGGS